MSLVACMPAREPLHLSLSIRADRAHTCPAALLLFQPLDPLTLPMAIACSCTFSWQAFVFAGMDEPAVPGLSPTGELPFRQLVPGGSHAALLESQPSAALPSLLPAVSSPACSSPAPPLQARPSWQACCTTCPPLWPSPLPPQTRTDALSRTPGRGPSRWAFQQTGLVSKPAECGLRDAGSHRLGPALCRHPPPPPAVLRREQPRGVAAAVLHPGGAGEVRCHAGCSPAKPRPAFCQVLGGCSVETCLLKGL